MYIINRKGPRIDSCGTPYIILSNSLHDEPAIERFRQVCHNSSEHPVIVTNFSYI